MLAKSSLRVFIVALASLAIWGRGITPEDYMRFEFAGAPALSPDGRQVAFTLIKINEKANRRGTTIWMVRFDGSAPPRLLTSDAFTSNNPQWSPDGSALAFTSNRGEGGRPQIWTLPMAGGEAQRVTNLKNGVSAFQWSPSGDRFVAVSRSGPSDNGKSKSDVRHYKHIRYKFNDSGWFDDKRQHLWVVDAKSGSAKQITDGDEWEDTDPQWSPNGRAIAFVSDRTGLAFESSRNTDVWTIPAEGGTLTRISDHPEADNSPRWSPDGRTIAFVGSVNARQHPKIYLAPSNGGASTLAVDGLDVLVTDMKWVEPNTILFESGVKGTTQLLKVDLAARKGTPLAAGERAIHNVSAKAGKLAYLVNDFKTLDDIYVADWDGSNERRLTRHNEALWKELELSDVERIACKSSDGRPVEGFLVKPIGFVAGRKYPLILSVHGGPAGQYGVDWYQEFQVYAGKGYGVFFSNPRGSTGYGEEWARGIKNNWGKMDYADVMAGLDEAIKRNAWIDTDRLGVTGGSYGGFMTNWIVSHTNRFKAAVTLRSVVNFISDDGTRDGAYGHEEDFKGFLFDQFDQYWEASPLKYAANVRTPTLILHSDNDLRVPLEQGEQWFRALKHYGVNTELVIFPRENHNLTRTGEPKHLVESMNWQLYWFDKFILNNSAAKPPDDIE